MSARCSFVLGMTKVIKCSLFPRHLWFYIHSSHSFSDFQAEGPQSDFFFLPEPFQAPHYCCYFFFYLCSFYYFCFEMGNHNRMNNSRYILLLVILALCFWLLMSTELMCLTVCLSTGFGQNWHVSYERGFRSLHLVSCRT